VQATATMPRPTGGVVTVRRKLLLRAKPPHTSRRAR
jgi:hypothetical protein